VFFHFSIITCFLGLGATLLGSDALGRPCGDREKGKGAGTGAEKLEIQEAGKAGIDLELGMLSSSDKSMASHGASRLWQWRLLEEHDQSNAASKSSGKRRAASRAIEAGTSDCNSCQYSDMFGIAGKPGVCMSPVMGTLSTL